MKNTLTLVTCLFISITALGQINYLKLRANYTASCGKMDSLELRANQLFVDSIAQFDIINGEEEFLYDYAWTYYHRYLKWKKEEDLEICIKYNEQCWKHYKNLSALWNLGSNYRSIGNCDKSLELTELYIIEMNKIDKTLIDYKQIYYRYKFCR